MELHLSPDDIEAIAEKVAEKIALAGPRFPEKDLWTVEELAARYGVCNQTIRNWMGAGLFGALVGERKKMVTAQGLKEYESREQAAETAKPARRYTHRGNPGKI